ncbi:MAG: radical SAM protein [Candidatus Aminicenantes bacterium]|nr:radical SAM protein [Candidatus Aminicenantes bacterium]
MSEKANRICTARGSKTAIQLPQTVFGYNGGTFPKDEILEARRKNTPLTMDCALPGRCLNNCTYCGFLYVNKKGKLRQQEVLRVFEEFAALGGKSIKILGEGEPMLRKDILFLLATIRKLGMIPILFTCGDTLGSEELAQKAHRLSCDEIVQKLYDIGVTVMIKYEKDEVVQRKGYSILRDRALERLLSCGFNKHFPSRLGFAIVLLKETYDEVPSVFDFALDHNIYPLVCPLMPLGKMKNPIARANYSPKPCEIQSLTQKLIELRERKGIRLSEPSDFPGGLPCDISRTGMYMDDIGNVKVCEADETVGNVRDFSLAELWRACSETKNKKYGELRWAGLCFPKRNEGIVGS